MNTADWLTLPATALQIIAAVLLVGVLVQALACRRHWRDLRRGRAGLSLVLLLVFLALAAVLGAAGYTLRGYHLLTEEVPVLHIQAQRIGPQSWSLQLETAAGEWHTATVHGDAWRVEAIVLKWKLPGVLGGLPPVYRLDRLSGRWADAARAAAEPAGTLAFPSAGEHDLFRLALAHQDWLPMVDTIYGSGAWMPLADGGRWEVTLQRGGALVARRTDAGGNQARTP